MKTTIAAIAFSAFLITGAVAEPTFQVASVPTAVADLTDRLKSVCNGDWNLSTDARTACVTERFPNLVKDGSRFRNSGIGAEFNTLMNQEPR